MPASRLPSMDCPTAPAILFFATAPKAPYRFRAVPLAGLWLPRSFVFFFFFFFPFFSIGVGRIVPPRRISEGVVVSLICRPRLIRQFFLRKRTIRCCPIDDSKFSQEIPLSFCASDRSLSPSRSAPGGPFERTRDPPPYNALSTSPTY